MPTLANNKRAFRDYTILEKFEAGIQLTGPEVRSAKNGRAQLKDSYVRIGQDNQPYLYKCYIAPYARAAQTDYDPEQPRKLLLNASEINAISADLRGQNLTIIPLKMYTTRRGLIKLEIALAQGKRKYEKKKALKERESEKEIKRTLKKYS